MGGQGALKAAQTILPSRQVGTFLRVEKVLRLLRIGAERDSTDLGAGSKQAAVGLGVRGRTNIAGGVPCRAYGLMKDPELQLFRQILESLALDRCI